MSILPADLVLNLVIWALLALCLAAWQTFTARSPAQPSFGDLVRHARRWLLVRWLLLAGWAWLGWHLFVRTTI
jgi:hypothetical protein